MAKPKPVPLLDVLVERLLDCLDRVGVPIEEIAIAQRYGYRDPLERMPDSVRKRD